VDFTSNGWDRKTVDIRTANMYRYFTPANSGAEFCSSEDWRMSRLERFFYVRTIGHPVMGGSCGRERSLPVQSRSANPHESAHPFCSGEAENLNRIDWRMTMSKSKSASAQNVSQNTKPRCRKGDLAIVLVGLSAGQIVDVVEHYPEAIMQDGEVMFDVWHIKHQTDDPRVNYFREDKYLLPIRPGDLEETETDELILEGRQS